MLKSIMSKAALALVAAAAIFASCEKQPEAVAVQGVKLDESSILLYEGETQTLKATVTPSNATDASVTWSSDNTAVATVSDAGQVTAVKAGDAKITVTTKDGGKTATCAVTVKAKIVSVQGVSIEPSSVEMLLGEKKTLVAKVTPENASNASVTWSSSDASIATVSQNGEVEALKTGTVSITVKTVDGGFEASCSVKIDASQYNITFETNGGSDVAPQVINKGDKVTKPADPTKAAGLDGGLYEGEVDPDNGSVSFAGWYTDPELTKAYDFNTVPTADLTLYAKWNSDGPKPIDLTEFATTIAEADASKAEDQMWLAFQYMSSLGTPEVAGEKLTFTYVVAESNEYEIGGTLANVNVEVTVIGKGEERVLSHNMTAPMFRAEGGHIIISRNITISGNYNAQYAIVLENDGKSYGGNVTMLAGSKIYNCKSMSRAAAVYNNNGSSTFTLDGGEILNNVTTVPPDKAYGGAMCANWGKFIINSGVISGNETYCSSGTVTIGGAGSFPILNRGNAFQKYGGEIKDNKAEYTDGATGDEVGQQLVIGNHGRRNEKGIYKVDANLGENDNLQMDDRNTNPLWIAVQKVE